MAGRLKNTVVSKYLCRHRQIQAQIKGRLKTLCALSDGLLFIRLIRPF